MKENENLGEVRTDLLSLCFGAWVWNARMARLHCPLDGHGYVAYARPGFATPHATGLPRPVIGSIPRVLCPMSEDRGRWASPLALLFDPGVVVVGQHAPIAIICSCDRLARNKKLERYDKLQLSTRQSGSTCGRNEKKSERNGPAPISSQLVSIIISSSSPIHGRTSGFQLPSV